MSGVSMTENLFCETCRYTRPHHTDWDSSRPNEVNAQCEHFGPRAMSGWTKARKIGKMIYYFLQDRKQS